MDITNKSKLNNLLDFGYIDDEDYEKLILIKKNLKVTKENKSKEKKEVESAFKDFEVEKIDKSDKGYVVTARAFSVGKKNVEIDKNKFQMEIKSSIDSNDKNIKEYFGNEKNDRFC